MSEYISNLGIFSNLKTKKSAHSVTYQSQKNNKMSGAYVSASGITYSDIDFKEIFGFTKTGDTSSKTVKKGNRNLLNYKMRGYAKDNKLLSKYGLNGIVNNPNAPAQTVNGDEDGEVHLRCIYDYHDNQDLINCEEEDAISKPGHIVITDNTNGKKNTYKYRRLKPEEIEAGITEDGQKLNKHQFIPGNTYYVLVSATDENGNNIKSNHTEVYRLDFHIDDENETLYYNLEQDEGMDGSGESSIDYTKRK